MDLLDPAIVKSPAICSLLVVDVVGGVMFMPSCPLPDILITSVLLLTTKDIASPETPVATTFRTVAPP